MLHAQAGWVYIDAGKRIAKLSQSVCVRAFTGHGVGGGCKAAQVSRRGPEFRQRLKGLH